MVNSITLGGLPCYDPSGSLSGHAYNFFQSTIGAADPGWGKVLMTRKDFDSLPTSSTSTLIFTSGQAPAEQTLQTLKVEVYPAVAYPVSASVAGADQDMVCVVVFDRRLANREIKDASYNVQVADFSLDGSDNPIFFDSSKHSGSEFTWATLFDDLGVTDRTMASLPSWKPRNLVFNGAGKGQVIDECARKIYHAIGIVPTTYALRLVNLGTASTTNTNIRKWADRYLVFGSDVGRSKARIPSNVQVDFFVHDDADDPTGAGGAGVTTYRQSIDSGGSGEYGPDSTILVLDYIATKVAGTLKNESELSTVAGDIAQRMVADLLRPAKEETFAGIWPFYPDGEYRVILWQSGPQGATTRVRRNLSKPFLEREREQIGNLITGLGQQVRAGTDYAGYTKVWGASGIPKPTARYQVLTPLDDSLVYVWTSARFQ